MANIICPICKAFMQEPSETKEIYVGCSALTAHKTCIRTHKGKIDLPSDRKSIIKINKPKE